MRYLVALAQDTESNAQQNKAILDTALFHARVGRDTLLLTRVIDDGQQDTASAILSSLVSSSSGIRQDREQEAKQSLEVYAKDCLRAGIECSLVVLVDDNAGRAICKGAEEHKADCVVIGRHSLGMLQRLIKSSISKYCIDNAPCNVIVAKKHYNSDVGAVHAAPYAGLVNVKNPAEAQKVVAEADKQKESELKEERAERAANINQVNKLEDQEKVRRMHILDNMEDAEKRSRAIESVQDLALTHKLEEEERQRRITQDYPQEQHSQQRRLELERVKELEENERLARVRGVGLAEAQDELQRFRDSQQDLKLAVKLEEEERDRRTSEYNRESDQAKKDSALARSQSLEKIHVAVEREREERIRDHHAQDIKEVDAEIKKNKEIASRLEDEERDRRIREQKRESFKNRENSHEDLLKVKELEEEERTRRMATK